jgi:hypothetical protein
VPLTRSRDSGESLKGVALARPGWPNFRHVDNLYDIN